MNKHNGFSTVEVILVIVILGILSVTGWYVFNSNTNTSDSSGSAQSIKTNLKASSTTSDTSTEALVHPIKEFNLEIKLTKETSTLVHHFSDKGSNFVIFSLQNFIDEANANDYPYVTSSGGKVNCDSLASIAIIESRVKVETIGSEPYGKLLDGNGEPVQENVVKLKDGRYVLISGSQETCGGSSNSITVEKYKELNEKEREARSLLLSLLRTNLYSKQF
jgi:type II secretory pathway pseudopilin PulG